MNPFAPNRPWGGSPVCITRDDGRASRARLDRARRPTPLVAAGIFLAAGLPQRALADGPYKVSKVVKVGGEGTFDTTFADVEGRRLYIPRKSPGRITVFDLDTLAPAGEIPDAAANGVVVDSKSGHGFASSQPVVMWDAKTLKTVKTIDVQGHPDAILFDPFTECVFIPRQARLERVGETTAISSRR